MKWYKHIVFFLVMTVAAWSAVSLEIQNVDTDSGTLDIYMMNEEEVGGFQMELTGISITEASAPVGFMVSTSSTTILAFSLTGATISVGEGILTQVTYSNFGGESICFGEDTGSSGGTAISNGSGTYIAADWGDCYCGLAIDCADECGGTAIEDECGVCGGNGIPVGDCNCFEDTLDECNVCGGASTTCADCAGVPNGDNVEDNCGTCDDDPNNNCVQDCFGEWGGSAELDECFVCGGDGPMDGFDCDGNCTENCEFDCFDVFQGTGKFDNCSTCIDCSQFVEDCTQHPAWNQSCSDCAGELNGNAFIDACGICVGDTPGNPGCIFDCEGSIGYGSFDNCGECDDNFDNDCEIDCNGDWGGTSLIDNCGHCYGGATGEEACVQDCNSDWGGTAVIDDCNVCGGTNACFDCAGIPNGSAVIDNCGTCDLDYSNDCVPDCNGDWGGLDNMPDTGDEAAYDECGICGGGGIAEGTCDCYGNILDECGLCGGNNSCLDCEGIPNGNNVEDNCGVCDADYSNDCTPDCNGDWGGAAEFDNCGICDNDAENDCTQDCFGAWGGIAVEDECGVCGGSGIPNGICDCEGNIDLGCGCGEAGPSGCDNNCGSNLELDECGVCGGSGMPNEVCDCEGNIDLGCGCGEAGPSGCDNNCSSNLELDGCGVCGGDNSSCSWTNLTASVEEINQITLSWDAIDSRTTSSRSSGNRNRDCIFGACLFIENVDTGAGILDIYMVNSEEVGGFQFSLDGIEITGVEGGSAASADFSITVGSTTLIGFSLTGETIPSGEGILTRVSFSNFVGADICFAENDCSTGACTNVISDAIGVSVSTDWGGCACPIGLDECGICGGSGISDGTCDCYGNVEDECGVCDGDNSSCVDCADVPNGDSELDNCGTCDNESSNDCDMDCSGDWGGSLENDECGVCGGPGLGDDGYYMDCWNGMEYCSTSDCPIDPNAVSYKIYRNGLGIAITEIQGETEYTDLDLDYNEQYCYTVTFINGGVESHHSNQACSITPEMTIIEGCMSYYACNYDENVTLDDGSCWFANTGCGCETGQDALADNCGVCDTDPTNNCVPDCNDDWGGPDNIPDTGDEATYDECGICSGDGIAEGTCDCYGNILDECGVCGGDGSTCNSSSDIDCNPDVEGDQKYDCSGICDGAAAIDNCGLCTGGGTGLTPDYLQDCAGVCGGFSVLDECDICGGDGSSCSIEDDLPWTELIAVGGDNQIFLSWISPDGESSGSNSDDNSEEDWSNNSAVYLEIQNVDTDAGTLDIYMSNQAGCTIIETDGINFYPDMSEADCESVGVWFNGEVGGFQFSMDGIEITGVAGGSVEEANFTQIVNSTTIIVFSLTGATIPSGEGILTTVSFSDFVGTEICFAENDCSSGACTNVISDSFGVSASSEWGDCYCTLSFDCAGECGGTAIEDECGICGGEGGDFTCWDDSLACDVSTCPVNPDDYSYNVYRDGIQIVSSIVITNFTDLDLEASESHCYTITYSKEGEESDASTEACATTNSLKGCMDESACNYNPEASISNGSCWHASLGCECSNGQGAESDNCSECDLDPTNDCTPDCNNEWGGGSIIDECGVCGGTGPLEGLDCSGNELSLYNGLIPGDYELKSIYPNPFNPATNIIYGIPENAHLRIMVFDVQGRYVTTLVDGFKFAGYHEVNWDARLQPSGMYLVKIMSESFINTQKVVLMK